MLTVCNANATYGKPNTNECMCHVQLPNMALLCFKEQTPAHDAARPWSSSCYVQDAVRALKSRLADATAALQVSQSETLRLRTRVADLKAAVSLV